MKLEVVVWDDAIADGGWLDAGQGGRPHRCTTVGFVTVDEPTHIVVGGTWADLDGQIQTNNRMTIPAGWIVSRTPLNLAALRGKSALKDSRRRGKKPVTSARRKRKSFN